MEKIALMPLVPLVTLEILPWMLFLVLALILLLILIFYRQQIKIQNRQIADLRRKHEALTDELAKSRELMTLLPELQKIAKLDHDVNTPLCVITMSLGRAKKLGQQSGDELLLNNVKDITDAVARIGEIMQAVRVLKTHPLVVQNKAHTSTKEIGQ